MNTFITDNDMAISADNLDRKRIFSNIYENIHGLASLLSINDQLVNPVKDISKKVQCKMWIGCEKQLFLYIYVCYRTWYNKFANKIITKYHDTVNYKNIKKISDVLNIWPNDEDYKFPEWVTTEMINNHRAILISKDRDYYLPKWPECDFHVNVRYDWRIK